ncbi:MAG: hypothetical protein J2P24_17270 [Streptosporangiales bacterium]|nr:hypothetical protein [Streptosporangiales bacterium]MBO0890059.1 hypothetical protein [Acidothermales bacterium]
MHVDAWDPGYGTGYDAPDDDGELASDVTVELPPATWRPLSPPADVRPADVVLFVDGVRRLDANVWVVEDDGTTHPGLCASYAAGVVRCDGVARVVAQQVRRGVFTPSASVADVDVSGTVPVTYVAHHVARTDPDAPRLAVQDQLRLTEIAVAELARDGDADDGDLLVVDGPLRARTHLPRTLGYVKTQERRYLPQELDAVVADLAPGRRTPVFLMGSRWRRFAWYLRLPGPAGPPWAGIVRVECAAELAIEDVVALADASAATLPRFASREHRDPRAPQNLVPIAGLERALRARLGDPRLLRRGLRTAVAAG